MNRRQFIAGLMASTVATPAPEIARASPEAIWASVGQSLWFDLKRATPPIAAIQTYIGEWGGVVIREIAAKDFYADPRL